MPTLRKTDPPITIEAARDLYSMRFVIRHRRPTNKLQPEQMATILRASADQLEDWAAQMREEASTLTN